MILDLVSQPIHASVFAGFFNIPAKSGCEKLERRFGACRRLRTDDGLCGSNAKRAAGSMPKATRSGRTRLIARDGHSLHFGLRAPPTASQASVPGVVIETQLCSNDANVSGRTAARPIPFNI